jgi:hypothetical protein
MNTSTANNRSEQSHDDDNCFYPPSSAQVNTSLNDATNFRRPVSPTAAASARHTFFDPWNSSSTGHQRAENRLSGSTSWRVSRSLKLSEQYRGGLSGGKRVADTVGAGSEDFGRDGRRENGDWEKGAKGLRTGGQQSLAEIWGASKAVKSPFKNSANKLVFEKNAIKTEENPNQEQGTFTQKRSSRRLGYSCSLVSLIF